MTDIVDTVQDGDIDELFELFQRVYASNPRMIERDFFEWQFSRAPGTDRYGPITFLVQRSAGKIVGCLGFVPVEFRLRGESVWGAWSQNWYSGDDSGGGLGLLTEFFRRVDNRYALAMSARSEQIYRAYRIPILGRLPRWWAAIDSEAVIDLCGFTEPTDQGVIRDSATAVARWTEGTCNTVSSVTRFADGWDFHPDQVWPPVSHYARRSGAYLNWRYFDVPRHRYQAFSDRDQLAVFRIEPIMHSDCTVIRILEWTFCGADAGGVLRLIKAHATTGRPVLIDFHCTASCIGNSLGTHGFVPQERTQMPMPDLFRPLKYSGGYSIAIDLPPHRTQRRLDFQEWYVTGGEADIDRIKL